MTSHEERIRHVIIRQLHLPQIPFIILFVILCLLGLLLQPSLGSPCRTLVNIGVVRVTVQSQSVVPKQEELLPWRANSHANAFFLTGNQQAPLRICHQPGESRLRSTDGTVCAEGPRKQVRTTRAEHYL